MNIICCICLDCVLPSEELSANSCGHIFHRECILQWMKSSQTCPECRNYCAEGLLQRVYFSVAEEDMELEKLLLLKIKDNDEMDVKMKELLSEKENSMQKIIELEDKLMESESALEALIDGYQKKIKEHEKQQEEVKIELKTLQKGRENNSKRIIGLLKKFKEKTRAYDRVLEEVKIHRNEEERSRKTIEFYEAALVFLGSSFVVFITSYFYVGLLHSQ